ncbi:MAG TPA: hypothetical protein VD864_15310, partial [Nocardioides sp.]|nr:hypothetical protein [Nocardioides sp.]
MGLTVEQASGRVDRWDAIAGETRWVDYAHQESGGDLVVYVHTFRRVRERHDLTRDVVLWKPATTSVARRYAAGEWTAVANV